MTRQLEKEQLEIGETQIRDIKFNLRSRDDIPKILKGLHYLYITPELRKAIFALLSEQVAPGIDKKTGRPGMSLWEILVLGVLRLDLNCDYDRLVELANEHSTLRKMLGHSGVLDEHEYSLQTLKDNVALLTPELLDSINTIIVKAGHDLVNKKKDPLELHGRCDSFVVETDVHYPTDISLLFDGIRKVIQLSAQLSERHGLSEWRQHKHNVKLVKRRFRAAQQSKRGVRSNQQASERKKGQARLAKQALAHQDLLLLSRQFLEKSSKTIEKINSEQTQLSSADVGLLEAIAYYTAHSERQLSQIKRRVLEGEAIPSQEKVYSIFEPHTEWIVKGKAGVPVELGVRVCVLEDHYQFLLTHSVMEKLTDVHIAVPIIEKAKALFPALTSCSFDKGFHSPENQRLLAELLERVALRRKGKRTKKVKTLEGSEAFKAAHQGHSAIESCINALEVHGLDVCPDHGITGFKRYVSLAIMAHNIHRIGATLYQTERAALEKARLRARNELFALAA